MKKLLVLFFLLWAPAAYAGVPCSVPFNLTNGTTADATQVMANYNAILSCLANGAAGSGANSDITSLSALSTPISPAEGGSVLFAGGTATNVSNVITITSTVPSGFVLNPNWCVTFIPSASSTAATTLNVDSTGAKNLYKTSLAGPTPMLGPEIVANQLMMACYDGTEFIGFPLGSYADLISINQTVIGGAVVNPATNGNLGTLSTGTTTINCGLVPLQYCINNGTFTLAAPANDGACVLKMTNGASAVAPTFSGFRVGANIGDTYATANGNIYFISVTRINGTATYFIKATQ